MRAVMLEVDERLLEDRRRRGADRWTRCGRECLPHGPAAVGAPPGSGQKAAHDPVPSGPGPGPGARYETGLFRPGVADDYRVPDQTYSPADLVVEVRTPNDETDEKVPWYADLGTPDEKGGRRSDVLGARFEPGAGGGLRIIWDGGQAEIT